MRKALFKEMTRWNIKYRTAEECSDDDCFPCRKKRYVN